MSFRKKYGQLLKMLISVLLLVLQTVSFGLVLFLIYNKIVLEAPLATGGELLVAIYFVMLAFVFNVLDALKIGYHTKSNIILSQFISELIVNVVVYLQISLIHRDFVIIWPMLLLTGVNYFISFVWTVLAALFMKVFFPAKHMVLVYSDRKAVELIYKLIGRTDQYIINETLHLVPGDDATGGNLDEVLEEIKRFEAVVVCQVPSKERNDILKFCYENSINAYLPPRISDIFIRNADEIHQFDSPLLVCNNGGLSIEQAAVKRLFDIVISLLGIIILSPLFIIISLAVKIEDGGPVLYKQKRITKDEKEFDIFKFRSMIVDAEAGGKVIPARNKDPRITKVGSVIRKLRLDELPQLLNILKGDMSVVGPRPERVEHHEAYKKLIPEFTYRTKVKGGLTGFAQIMGKYNTSPYDKLVLDLMYITDFSFFLDIKLIMQTVKVMFMKESTEGFDEKESDTNE